MVLNRQRELAVDLAAMRAFVKRLRGVWHLGRREFNVCFVGDREIRRLNVIYRGKRQPTDVLSFPWQADSETWESGAGRAIPETFLGDIVISVQTARRNAGREGHSTANELRWLIVHGLLHLLGYDHERDGGEMNQVELSLRDRLGISGSRRLQKARGTRRASHE
jgi:probable rRNA maturation factor